MDSIQDVALHDRPRLASLLAGHRHLRTGVDSVLQGYCGTAAANGSGEFVVAKLAIGAITFFGGDAAHPAALRLVGGLSGVKVILVADAAWREAVLGVHGGRIKIEQRLSFSSDRLNAQHLRSIASRLPEGYRVERVGLSQAKRMCEEVDPDLILPEVFASTEDFYKRGIGFCALHGQRIVCGATSGLLCDGAIEIQINTHEDHRGLGLATAAGAALAAHCLEQGIEPRWDTASAASERVAQKLGYIPHSRYEWLILPK